MREFYKWAIDEAVEQQRNRIMQLLGKLFPQILPPYESPTYQNMGQSLFRILQSVEATLENQDDVRKSATISQFLNNYKPNPADSVAHTMDRFKRELQAAVYKANNKNKTPEQLSLIYRQELIKKLPNEPVDVINQLMAQVQQGARVDDVVNAYQSKKNAISGHDVVVAREGTLEMIEVTLWREDGSKEQHIDRKKGVQACHPLFKGTKWCIRFQEYFNDYTAKGPLYLIRENGKPLILGHPESEWLDTEDEPPDANLMKRLSVFIMNNISDSPDLAKNTIMYLPKPVQMTEEYIAKGVFKPAAPNEPHELLLGQDYKLNHETLIITKFEWLHEALVYLSGLGDNKISVSLEAIEQSIQDNASYHNAEVDDLVGWLQGEVEDQYIAYLEKRRTEGYYNDIENWDELDLSDTVLAINREYKHDDAIDLLFNASIDATTEETMNKIIKGLSKELESGDELGFFVNKDWELCIYADRVNAWIAENIVAKGGFEHYKDNGMINHMNFVIEESDINFDFSSKIFNRRVGELIKEH